MLTTCACGIYEIEQSDARYRKGDKPMCHEETCRRVRDRRASRDVPVGAFWGFREHRSLAEVDLARREQATRIVALPGGGFDVVG